MTLAWWSTHGNKIPSWKKAARRVFAISPTSAAVERGFSNLNAYVSKSISLPRFASQSPFEVDNPVLIRPWPDEDEDDERRRRKKEKRKKGRRKKEKI